MDSLKENAELVIAICGIGALLLQIGRLRGTIEQTLRDNATEHAAMWKHQQAQDEMLREHDRSIEQIKERIRHPCSEAVQ